MFKNIRGEFSRHTIPKRQNWCWCPLYNFSSSIDWDHLHRKLKFVIFHPKSPLLRNFSTVSLKDPIFRLPGLFWPLMLLVAFVLAPDDTFMFKMSLPYFGFFGTFPQKRIRDPGTVTIYKSPSGCRIFRSSRWALWHNGQTLIRWWDSSFFEKTKISKMGFFHFEPSNRRNFGISTSQRPRAYQELLSGFSIVKIGASGQKIPQFLENHQFDLNNSTLGHKIEHCSTPGGPIHTIFSQYHQKTFWNWYSSCVKNICDVP